MVTVIFRDADGRNIAFSWTGDPEGPTTLLVRRIVTGYSLMEEGVDELHRQGISCTLSLVLPSGVAIRAVSTILSAMRRARYVSLARHLRIESWPAMGTAPVSRAGCACLDPAARISSILRVAAYLPYRRSENFQSFPPAREIAFRLARKFPISWPTWSNGSATGCAVARKARFVEGYMFSDCAPDREALRNPECADVVASAGRFMIAHQHRAVPAICASWQPTGAGT